MGTEIFNNWEQTKAQLKKDFPELTEQDLELEIDKEAELLKKLQDKLQKKKKEIRKWLSLMG